MPRKQSGFTLIEIAIVLVIIGLLLGGVLKGQELINSAKIKNLSSDLNGISAAIYAYQDRFKALPGDDKNAASRWASATAGDGSAVIGGTFDATTGESVEFWRHLRLAGLIGGDPTSAQPQNAVGGIIGVQTGAGSPTVGATMGLTGTVVCHSNLLGKVAESLDVQIDDGKPNGGAVKAWKVSTGLGVAADIASNKDPETAYVDDGTTKYIVCKTAV